MKLINLNDQFSQLHSLFIHLFYPLFPLSLSDGKKCPSCELKIYHDKWRVTDKLAEDRWAHQQARERELEEVTDFFNDL